MWYRASSFFVSMVKMVMASSDSHYVPTIFLKSSDNDAGFHESKPQTIYILRIMIRKFKWANL